MIQIHTGLVGGWEAAVRGMRNPMNSWAKSDSTLDFHMNDGDFASDTMPKGCRPEGI